MADATCAAFGTVVDGDGVCLGQMEKKSIIYVAGHTGLVGSAVLGELEASGYHNVVMGTHSELDLTQQSSVESFFNKEKPAYVILAAAKVGGIKANDTYPADLIMTNIQIQTNKIRQSNKTNHSYTTRPRLWLLLHNDWGYF